MEDKLLKKDSIRLFKTYGNEHIIATFTGIVRQDNDKISYIYKDALVVVLMPDPTTGKPVCSFIPLSIFGKDEIIFKKEWIPNMDNMLIVLEEDEIEEPLVQAYKNRNSKIITPPSREIILPH